MHSETKNNDAMKDVSIPRYDLSLALGLRRHHVGRHHVEAAQHFVYALSLARRDDTTSLDMLSASRNAQNFYCAR